MKKIILNLFLLFCVMLNMGAGCSKEADAVSKEPEYTSLIGYWLILDGFVYGIKNPGDDPKALVTVKEGVFAYEFFANGTVTGYDLTKNGTPPESGTWKLEVKTLDGKKIKKGTLSLTTKSTKQLAGSEFVEADGSMKFDITTNVVDGKDHMYLTTKKYESYPYAECFNLYIYEKK